MIEGYWINYLTGKVFELSRFDDHEHWIRTTATAKDLGLSTKQLVDICSSFTPRRDRDRFLVQLMAIAPVMRVRGHRSDASVTFEFHTRNPNYPRKHIADFVFGFLGPQTLLNIYNFATGKRTVVHAHEYCDTRG